MTRAGRLPAWLLASAAIAAVALAQQAVVRAGRTTPQWLAAPASAPPDAAAAGTVLRQRALRFVPLADGSEAVIDDATGGLVRLLGSDHTEQSFLRVTVRVLQEMRQLRHADTGAPFLLALHDPDGLVLEDPLTRSRLAVRAFGVSAVAALRPLLDAPVQAHGALPPACPRLEC